MRATLAPVVLAAAVMAGCSSPRQETTPAPTKPGGR
jgi:hypothetical protein